MLTNQQQTFEKDQEYYAVLGRLASLAMAEKVRNGEIVCRPPLGYRMAFSGGARKVEVDEGTAPLVRKAFLLAAEGRYSIRELLTILAEDGLTAPGGGEIGPSTLWNVLKNPFYAGYLRYKGRIMKGAHEPIIRWKTYEQVQENLCVRKRNP